ncbi:HAMP domain-containing sensor histidine kinase [Pedobacter sp. Du54]|uniref:sensor histidine kinase n=1 Tax=Pedobacter anseongensis TaxID=3133439 RepID=UPI0030A52024
MQKNGFLLTILCLVAIAVLLGLQGYWISKYYALTKKNFATEVNLAFEDAIKKEFSNRADSIEKILTERLLDTSYFLLTSKFNKTQNRVIYTVKSNKNKTDKYSSSFSLADLNIEIGKDNSVIIRNKIAVSFANLLRNEDLENHIVYYRTQDLGNFMFEIVGKMQFDTLNLRPVLNKYLTERSIFVDYTFYTKEKDSTTNKSNFNSALLKKYPVITRALPTYSRKPGQNYVRVMFKDPYSYILSNMWFMLLSSLFLVVLIAFCLSYLLRSLRNEKRLALIKNDFISNITHEFKTPIATAMLAVEALNDKTVLANEEKTERYLKHAKNELTRISALTDKILKLSVYDNNNYSLKKEEIQINSLIEEIIELHAFQKPNCTLTFENNTVITSIRVDKEQFQHALSNIIENAIKYGNDPIAIQITCQLDSSYFIISIKDNGPGIDAAEVPFIFEKFYRAKQSSTTTVKGYGLGLNYVKQIMHQHNGWYKLTSSASGTELKLAWPV